MLTISIYALRLLRILLIQPTCNQCLSKTGHALSLKTFVPHLKYFSVTGNYIFNQQTSERIHDPRAIKKYRGNNVLTQTKSLGDIYLSHYKEHRPCCVCFINAPHILYVIRIDASSVPFQL
jgi:hypothetical protein